MYLVDLHLKPALSPTPVSLETYSVLVAEDDRNMADLLAINLVRTGHRIAGIAWDGKEAVRLALKERPDLVIMDVQMPFLDGLQAASEILSANLIPIILTTGRFDLRTIQRAMDIQGLSYLVKPYSPNQLHVTIQLAVAQCRRLGKTIAVDALQAPGVC